TNSSCYKLGMTHWIVGYQSVLSDIAWVWIAPVALVCIVGRVLRRWLFGDERRAGVPIVASAEPHRQEREIEIKLSRPAA
ncbi:MAG: hypothetical protein ACREAC_13270, partial [Blastocatellia bacterium]